MFLGETVTFDKYELEQGGYEEKLKKQTRERAQIRALGIAKPGLGITTIEFPADIDPEVKWYLWHNILQQLQCASGVVIFRGYGKGFWNYKKYHEGDAWFAEMLGIVAFRGLYIINMAYGAVRSNMIAFPAMSTISLAHPDATFGFPECRLGGIPTSLSVTLRRRVHDSNIREWFQKGSTINAQEALRLGLVDFVGDIEAELARLIHKLCMPRLVTHLYGADIPIAVEERGDDFDDELMPTTNADSS